jgi:glycosyltransferase involved in cell wall biosynthesis
VTFVRNIRPYSLHQPPLQLQASAVRELIQDLQAFSGWGSYCSQAGFPIHSLAKTWLAKDFMPSQLEISVILTTYQRPAHLERSLLSLAYQRGMNGKFEVIVADDGSADRTQSVVRQFARTAPFPLHWVSHRHDGFRVSLCRNDGVRASSSPYFLFTDSDCIFPADHLFKHVQARRPGIIRAGDCIRLDEETSDRVNQEAIASGAFTGWASREEQNRLFKVRLKDQYYRLTRHPKKPKLTGFNIGISRDDFEAVNGFDENFVGWGCEDDYLTFRLRKAGRRVASVLAYTHGFHLWHPPTPSRPDKWTDGPNVRRLDDADRPIRCAAGLISISIVAGEREQAIQHRSARAA